MEKKVIDARGLSCPQPVLLTKKALASNENAYEVLVDNATAKENVTRFANNSGYSVSVTEKDGDYCLSLSK
ncbi:MAG: sulfurtransferase TusA family protein [Negativibacillus sp.]